MAVWSIRCNRKGSRGPSVIVMKATEHQDGDDLAVVVVVGRGVRHPLPNTLMRPGLVEAERVFSNNRSGNPANRNESGQWSVHGEPSVLSQRPAVGRPTS